jgi:hypothetical protein
MSFDPLHGNARGVFIFIPKKQHSYPVFFRDKNSPPLRDHAGEVFDALYLPTNKV